MTVSTILAAKGRDVVTIKPSASRQKAYWSDSHTRCGSPHRWHPLRTGHCACTDAYVLGEPVSVAMTRRVSTCNETETVSSIMERMSAGKFRHMPVVDQGRLVGMVSIGDVVKHRLHAMERDSAAMRDYIVTA